MSYGFMSHVTAIVKLLAHLTAVCQTTKLCKSTDLLSRQLAQWQVDSCIHTRSVRRGGN